ncbi:hypothetical protein GCM10027445_21590 [Amycolatopsis endophytica]
MARHLSVRWYLVLVVVYVAVVQVLGFVLTRGTGGGYETTGGVWRSITVPVGVGLVLVGVTVTVLRWWRPVLTDDRPVRRWVAVVPVLMIVSILAGTDYGGLAARGAGFTVLLLAGTLFVGFAEEGLFRGIGLVALRGNGLGEGGVALWSSVVFGLAHSANLVSLGARAFVQVFVVAVAGYFFYLVRRRSGGLLLPAVLHGLWDFALITGSIVPGESYPGSFVVVVALIVLAIVVFRRRHRIEPGAA